MAIIVNNTLSNSSGPSQTDVTATQMNEYATAYLAEAREAYAADPSRTQSVISKYYEQISGVRKDEPIPLSLTTGVGTLIMHDDAHNYALTSTVETAGANDIYHISPSGGEYVVKNGNTISQYGLIKPTGVTRMIYLPSVQNVRDIGGYTSYNSSGTSDGTIKYGLIYRTADVINGSAADKKFLVNTLGVRYEIDLGTNEQSSSVDDNVVYVPCYLNFDTDGNKGCIDLTKGNVSNAAKAVRAIMNSVSQGEACFFHCYLGADRTGTIAYVIESLLGMNEVDLDIDYEYTSFSTALLRTRTGQGSSGELSSRYPAMIEYLKSLCSTQTVRDGAVMWCIKCGITIDEINAFRQTMIDGDPEIVEPKPVTTTYTVTNILNNATNSNTATEVTSDETYTGTITFATGHTESRVCVLVGDENITSSAYDSSTGEITIVKPTGNVRITANALDSNTYTPLEYIQSTGTQYIDTGLVAQINTDVYMDMMFTSFPSASSMLYGIANNTEGTTNRMYTCALSPSEYFIVATVSYNTGTVAAAASTKYLVHSHHALTGTYSMVNGTKVATAADQTSWGNADNYNHYIFCRNKANAINEPSNMKLYGCEFYVGGTIVGNYVPALRITDSKPGLYDFVSGNFLVNAGTGEFEYPGGEETYTTLNYIKGTGTQYITTEITPKFGMKYDCNLMIDQGSTEYMLYGSTGASSSGRMCVYSYTDNTWAAGFADVKSEGTSQAFTAGTKYHMVFDTGTSSQVLYVDDTSKITFSVSGTAGTELNSYPIYILARNSGGTIVSNPANAKLYNFKIYDSDGTTLIADYVPKLRNSDSKPGLWDNVTSTFLTNAGTGEFEYEIASFNTSSKNINTKTKAKSTKAKSTKKKVKKEK